MDSRDWTLTNLVSSAEAIEDGPVDVAGIPTLPNRLIGRDSSIAAATDLLRDGEVRLVTFTGAGGIGKTSLAVEVASILRSRFRDGVRFVSLAPIADASQLVQSIACSLGVRADRGGPSLEQLLGHLRRRHLLLLLDTFEHLLPVSPVVSQLLAGAPELKVLVTSRCSLRVQGGREFPVPALDLPDLEQVVDLRRLSDVSSVKLFVERAQAVERGFRLTEENAASVAAVCVRLEGIPLAIELAAARVKLFPPKAMLERLTRPLNFLAYGARDLPERQRSLRRSIDWSYDLLGADEKTLFSRLAVFAGGGTVEAADEIGHAGGRQQDPLGTLMALEDCSLLVRLDTGSQDVRIKMLESVREFALEQLRSGGEEREVRRAHAEMYLMLAEQGARALSSPSAVGALAVFDAERDNLHAALQWHIDSQNAEPALSLCVALARYWLLRGLLAEGRAWLSNALALGERASPATRARSLIAAGDLAQLQSDYIPSANLYREGHEMAIEAGDPIGAASALTGLGTLEKIRGDYASAHRSHEQAFLIADGVGDRHGAATCLRHQASVMWFEGRPEALDQARRSLEIFTELGDPQCIALATRTLGWCMLTRGEAQRARVTLEEATATFRRLGDKPNIGRTCCGLGALAARDGNHLQAEAYDKEALVIARELGDRRLIAACLEVGAGVELARKQVSRAMELLAASEKLHRTLDAQRGAQRQAAFEHMTASARAALGEEAFRRGWAQALETDPDELMLRSDPERSAPSEAADGLSSRELDVLRLVAAGLSDPAIARQLYISKRTVNAHVRSVYRKLNLRSRVEAARYVLEHGLD